MATSDSPLSITASRGLSLALGQSQGAVNWPSRLSRTGPGTNDPAFDPNSFMTYAGAFRIPNRFPSDIERLNFMQTICYNPPEAGGRNGPNGSLFVGGRRYVCEVQIPSDWKPNEQNHLNLSEVTLLQDYVDVRAKAPNQPANDQVHWIGWMKVVNGRLFMSMYDDYDTGPNTDNLLICNDLTDLANASYQGLMNLEGEDAAVKYIMDVPLSLQASFGGTHLSGICASISIIDRTSYGHSLYAWTPDNVQSGDTLASTTQWTQYDSSNPIDGYSKGNDAIVTHYSNELGEPLGDYVASDPATRLTSLEGLPLPDESIRKHIVNWDTKCGVGFFVPNTDTIAFVGWNSGMRYGIGYKNYTIEYGTDRGADSGNSPYSVNDYDNVVWAFNVNDVLNRTNPYDPQHSDFALLQDPWGEQWGDGIEGSQGKIISGDFDAVNNRAFFVHPGFYWSEFSSQWVISVFDVGA